MTSQKPTVLFLSTEVRYSPLRSIFDTGTSSTQIPSLDCPSRGQKFFAACEMKSRTRLTNS